MSLFGNKWIPAYIAEDMSGVDKETLYQNHLKLKDSFFLRSLEDESLKQEIDEAYKIEINTEKNNFPPIEVISDVEIREISELVDGESVIKKYFVHPVDVKNDSLFKLAYLYKVDKKEIQHVNKFSGEDIYFMKEILIPYKFMPKIEV